jgi:hypothetical protein
MEDLQPQAAAAATLCETCSGFDWTTWLRDKIVQAYILHPRFESVINAALAGCGLCAFVMWRPFRTANGSRNRDKRFQFEHDLGLKDVSSLLGVQNSPQFNVLKQSMRLLVLILGCLCLHVSS